MLFDEPFCRPVFIKCGKGSTQREKAEEAVHLAFGIPLAAYVYFLAISTIWNYFGGVGLGTTTDSAYATSIAYTSGAYPCATSIAHTTGGA